jgi:hypothetical protein
MNGRSKVFNFECNAYKYVVPGMRVNTETFELVDAAVTNTLAPASPN